MFPLSLVGLDGFFAVDGVVAIAVGNQQNKINNGKKYFEKATTE